MAGYSGPQQQMIVDSFNSQIYVSNTMDVQNAPLYDTVTIAANNTLSLTTGILFTNVGANSNKNYSQTNLQQSQKLPAPQAFSIFGLRFRYTENLSLLDVYNVVNGFALEVVLGDKVYQRGPIWFYSAGGGVFGVTTATSTTFLNNGLPGRSEMHKLAISMVIENQMTFYAQLNGNPYTLNPAGTGITYQLVYDGLYARGVQ